MSVTYQTDAERAYALALSQIQSGLEAKDGRIAALTAENARLHKSAERFDFLFDQLMERETPDGRAVLELDPIWVKPEGTGKDWMDAIDRAKENQT
jgi:uncharacterized protein YuzE